MLTYTFCSLKSYKTKYLQLICYYVRCTVPMQHDHDKARTSLGYTAIPTTLTTSYSGHVSANSLAQRLKDSLFMAQQVKVTIYHLVQWEDLGVATGLISNWTGTGLTEHLT